MTSDIGWNDLDKSRFYFFSTFFLLGTRFSLYPIMLVKTRMQALDQRKGLIATGRHVVQTEGIRGLYRGCAPMTLAIVPTQTTYVSVLEWVRGSMSTSLKGRLGHEAIETMASNLVAGGVASCASAALGVPIDVVVQRMQLGLEGRSSTSFFSVLKSVVSVEGFAGLYRGYLASLSVYVPTSAIWWSTYANMRTLEEIFLGVPQAPWQRLGRDAINGGIAGITAALITSPLDTTKTRLQTAPLDGLKKPSFYQVAKALYEKEGVRGFYRGASARVASMTPTSVLMIVSYETVKKLAVKQ